MLGLPLFVELPLDHGPTLEVDLILSTVHGLQGLGILKMKTNPARYLRRAVW